ncbi:preprotein translocase subunit SecE [Floccifex sp.]|uniref:preprotein translocase subunit SecE n=1 Tax=Floccifex sp. TaxID=2815810 RepID=UPI003F00FD6A
MSKKKEKKDFVYSPKGVIKELKTVEWPSFSQLMKSSGLVILFTVLFGLYFFICEIAASGFLNLIIKA